MNKYTVGQVNAYIRNMFTQDYMLRSIVVSGEASNVNPRPHPSGHKYFKIKDENSELSCVLYRQNAMGLKFDLKNGDQVEITGTIDVYEKTGQYQLKATKIVKAGLGALYEEFLRLQKDLSERGMFDEMYKKPIPRYVTRLGVVTAPTGAAVQDIIQISKRRNPYIQIILYPAQVQGEGAKESIVAGIRSLDQLNVDVIIVGRGGGSIEDLWAFNEECVAEAIFDCQTPVISAVGHETDTTIADFVADLRAPTPSAAAEMAVFNYSDFEAKLEEIEYRLKNSVNSKITSSRYRANQKEMIMKGLSPEAKLKLLRLEYGKRFDFVNQLMNGKINDMKHQVMIMIERLKSLSPLERLEMGFASVTDENGEKVKSVSKLNVGDSVMLTMKDGRVDARVEKVEKLADRDN